MNKDFRTTGEYNQIKTKVKGMLDISSGHILLPNFMLLNNFTESTWIFVLPMNDVMKAGEGLNSWGIIVTSDLTEINNLLRYVKAVLLFGSEHISRLLIIDMIQFKVSTKLGKEKAAEKIADFIFDWSEKND